MTQRAIPRFFSGRAGDSTAGYPLEIDPAHVVDNFFAGGGVVNEQEWAITVDSYGRLQGVAVGASTELAPALQTQLSYNDVACGSRLRYLNARNFYLFHMQLLEQPADAPGLNDPLYLYGTIYGPYPEAGSDPASYPGVEGQLTVTRADLLDGIISGAGYAFRSALEGGAGPAERTFNVLLPGDRDQEISSGVGLIMMYPLHPAEMIYTSSANEIVMAQLLYDLLANLKDDLVRNKVNNPLRSITLPVPNRYVMEQDLIEQGYKIKNGVAIRSKLVSTNQFSGVLASVFGNFAAERLELPPEGTVDDLIAIARDTIERLPGWPPPRTIKLRNRCQPVTAEVRQRASKASPARTPVVHIPRSTDVAASHAVPHSSGTSSAASKQAEAKAWMRDFMQAHANPGAAPPRITSASRPPGPKKSEPEVKPEWMKDFE